MGTLGGDGVKSRQVHLQSRVHREKKTKNSIASQFTGVPRPASIPLWHQESPPLSDPSHYTVLPQVSILFLIWFSRVPGGSNSVPKENNRTGSSISNLSDVWRKKLPPMLSTSSFPRRFRRIRRSYEFPLGLQSTPLIRFQGFRVSDQWRVSITGDKV